MKVLTKSGSVYDLEVVDVPGKGRLLSAYKAGWPARSAVVAVYPDRIPFLEATETLRREGDRVIGFNKQGTITLRFDPLQVRPGMILANRKGLRSTEIVSVGA